VTTPAPVLARRRRISLPERWPPSRTVIELGEGVSTTSSSTHPGVAGAGRARLRLSGEHTVVPRAGRGDRQRQGRRCSTPWPGRRSRRWRCFGRPRRHPHRAAVWGDGAAPRCSTVGVPERHHRTAPDPDWTGWCWLDLPDHDSTRLEHRPRSTGSSGRSTCSCGCSTRRSMPTPPCTTATCAALHARRGHPWSCSTSSTCWHRPAAALPRRPARPPGRGRLDRARLAGHVGGHRDGIDALRTAIGMRYGVARRATDRLSADSTPRCELGAAIGVARRPGCPGPRPSG